MPPPFLNRVKADVQYREKLDNLHKDLPFLLEKMAIDRVKKPIANLDDKEEYYTHKKFKESNSSWISFEKRLLRLIKKLD